MLHIRLGELSHDDRDRLRTELIAILSGDLTYPPFPDPHAGTLRTRPPHNGDRQRASDFLASARFDTFDTLVISSSVFVERLTDLFKRYQQSVSGEWSSLVRRDVTVPSQAARLAQDLQKRLLAYVIDGDRGTFGAPPPPHTWQQSLYAAPASPPWEAIAPGSVALATALARARNEPEPVVARQEPELPDVATQRIPAIVVAEAPHPLLTAPLPQPVATPAPSPVSPPDAPVFRQLREQMLQAMMAAGRNYGLDQVPEDPAGLLHLLRQRDLIDDTDLHLAEGVLALCARVIADGRASIDDYRQGLMLYLLFNRRRLRS